MTLLLTLLAKDLRRAVRNPIRWAIPLLVPVIITALVGVAFGPRTSGGKLGTIRIALVDEDKDGILGRFLGNMPRRPDEDMPFQLEAERLERSEALRRITDNEISAVVIIPEGFLDAYLGGSQSIALQIIKNPAQAIHPAIVEEGLSVLVTLLNAASRVLGDNVAEWRELLTSDDEFVVKLLLASELIEDTGNRLKPLRDYLSPPLVSFNQRTLEEQPAAEAGPDFNLFGYLLIGMAGMFLLYIADNAMRDLYRETQQHTLERFQTIHEGLAVMITSKVALAMVVLMSAAAFFFVGGGLLFRISWERPAVLLVLVFCYALFAAGFLGFVGALAGTERRADTLNNILIMVIAVAGGCMFPPEGLPVFFREVIMPWMPTAWFAATAREIQGGDGSANWMFAAAKLVALGVVLIAASSFLFKRRISRGLKA